jgi:hypothetical protein
MRVIEVEWLYPDAISRQDKPLFILRPDRNSEHPPEFVEALSVPLQKGLDNDLSIRARLELMASRFQFPSQLLMIVNFSIEHDDYRSVATYEWLIAAVQVDNFQSDGAERYMR